MTRCRWLGDGGGYDAAMQLVRLTSLLLSITMALQGCAIGLKPAATMPTSFTDGYVQVEGMTFESLQPGAGVMTSDAVVTALRGRTGQMQFLQHPAVPFFGVLRCTGAMDSCQPGPAGFLGPSRLVWVVVYPDWTDQEGDVAWVVVDALTGLDNGFVANDPRDH
jgi:hypothetical protein